MQRALDKLITLLTKVCRPVSRRLSVMLDQFDSLIPYGREDPCCGSEDEQIRILLERQKEQMLADCRAEIQKHEFHANYDRRSIQKLNENDRVAARRTSSRSSRRTSSTRSTNSS